MASICFVFHFSLTRELAQQLLSLVAFLLRDILGRELHVCLAIWWTLFVGGSMRLDISKFQRSKKVVRAIFSISEVMAYFNNVVFFFFIINNVSTAHKRSHFTSIILSGQTIIVFHHYNMGSVFFSYHLICHIRQW